MELAAWISGHAQIDQDLAGTLSALGDEAVALSARIAQGALAGQMAAEVGENTGGDAQKALDVIADEGFMAALKGSAVRWYASEEQEGVVALNPQGSLALAIDPLDGSSNIDVNVSIGTIFSIFPATDDAEASFLRQGQEQTCAGYFIYGPQTSLVLTVGDGVHVFTLDRQAGTFVKTADVPAIPHLKSEYAINASNRRHWPKPIRAYIEDCEQGETGPLGRNYNMRWVASLVAEAHRILMRGGVFLYPGDAREGYGRGRLRTVYECAPIAFLIEQAGGAATDGASRLLDQVPKSLHARTPFVFGSRDKVLRVAAYHDLPDHEVSPLFGKRGLFKG